MYLLVEPSKTLSTHLQHMLKATLIWKQLSQMFSLPELFLMKL